MTKALVDIMDDVSSYGGHLASLIATLLSDVLNSDPHVVHHVHKSGIAQSFLNMLLGRKIADPDVYEPILPPVPELIMALPNVISALALTEDGAKAVKEANPFPSMLRLFHNPNYAMPKSRCLLNEMTAIVGTGLAFLVGGYVVSWVRHAPPTELPLIGEVFSWQLTFIYVGAPGLLVLLLLYTIREPKRSVTKQVEGAAVKGSWAQVREFYGQNWAALWRHHFGYMFLILLGYAFVFWTPSFFERIHGVPAEEASKVYGTIFIFFGGGAAFFAGWLAEWFARRGKSDATLLSALWGASLFVPTLVIIQFIPSLTAVYIMYAPALFFMNMPYGLGHAALAQITPPDIRGRVAAVYTIMGSIGNALGPPIAGFFNDVIFPEETGVSSSIMTMCIFFGVLGIAFVWSSRKPFRAAMARAQAMDL